MNFFWKIKTVVLGTVLADCCLSFTLSLENALWSNKVITFFLGRKSSWGFSSSVHSQCFPGLLDSGLSKHYSNNPPPHCKMCLMCLQGKGLLYAVTYPLLSTVMFWAVFLVLTVNHPHSWSEYTHRRLSQFCQIDKHAKEMEGQGGKRGRYWRNPQTLVGSGFCLVLIFASYPFAFWTVGNMVRDDFNGDLFMSDALLYWREESLEAHSSFRSLSFLGEWNWDLNWDGIHFQRKEWDPDI